MAERNLQRYDVNRLKLRRALSELNILQNENNRLFHLLCVLSETTMKDALRFKHHMHEVKEDVAALFHIDDEYIDFISKMIELTFLGLSLNKTTDSHDRYAFTEVEKILRGCDRLSIVGTAMRLSLERYDGSGPLSLESQFIPSVCVVYRAILCFAEAKHICKEPAVLCHELERKLSLYVCPELQVLLLRAFGLTHHKQKIAWINVFSLRPGMTILEDVMDAHGVLLITKQTELDEKLIHLLLSYDQMQDLERDVPVIIAG